MKNVTVEKQVIEVSYQELVNLLLTVESGTFINMLTVTDVRMRKTNNPHFGNVRKLSSCNYYVGSEYQKRVNSNMEKQGVEGDFVSQKPKGKTHVSKCVLIDDKTGQTHYLMVERFNEIKPQYNYVTNDFDPIEKELFQQFMSGVSTSSRQPQERKVSVITPKVENILTITLNGIKYVQVN